MKKDFKIFKIMAMGSILFLIIFSALLMDYFPRDEVTDSSPALSFTFDSTIRLEGTQLRIDNISTNFSEPADLRWWLGDLDDTKIAQNDFPLISRENGFTKDYNISVVWFDKDNNGNLSINDTIEIQSELIDLRGLQFKIISSFPNESEIIFLTVLD